MSYLLRKVRKARWDPAYRIEIGLASDDIPSDCLADLNTSKCALSLWQVHADRSNVDAITAAMASTRDIFANFEFTLVDYARVEAIGALNKTEGDSPNVRANNDWHWDLSGLSTDRLNQLATVIYQSGIRFRIIRRDVENIIRNALRTGQIDRAKVNDKLRPKLGIL